VYSIDVDHPESHAPSASPPTPRPRRGVALAVALMAMVLIGAMIAGASYFAMQNGRASDNSRRVVQAGSVVEAAIADVVHNWNPVTYNVLAKGDSITIAQTVSPQSKGTYQGKLYKLSDKTYLIDLTAWDAANSRTRGAGARQRLATLLRIVPLQIRTTAALTIADKVIFGGGNSIVQGADQIPAGWNPNCPPAGAAVAGVIAKDTGDIRGSLGQYTGVPDKSIMPTLDSMAYTRFGGLTYWQLAATATFDIAPGAIAPGPAVNAGACVTSTPTNWGDGMNPTAPCGNFFPTVHINGGPTSTTTLASGQGQGILLVDGDLVVSGTWTYYGVLIVRGTFKTTGVGAPKVYGTVLAKTVDFTSTGVGAAAAVVNYSACVLDRSMNSTSRVSPMRSRGYVRMM
jgi:hypothetical protein